MQLASHEAHELKELAFSCVNTLTNMSMFILKIKDPELKSMLEKQYAAHVQDYNIKVEYLSKEDGPAMKLQVPELTGTMQCYTKSEAAVIPAEPRVNITEFDDREMATAYLLTLKRAGREYAWSAMEASNPGIRAFLEDAFTMASHHAFEVWQWMVKKGYYPLEEEPQDVVNTYGKLFKPLPAAGQS